MNQSEALSEIFSKKSSNKLVKSCKGFRVWRSRFKSGKLSPSVQVEILKKFGYILKKEAFWSKST